MAYPIVISPSRLKLLDERHGKNIIAPRLASASRPTAQRLIGCLLALNQQNDDMVGGKNPLETCPAPPRGQNLSGSGTPFRMPLVVVVSQALTQFTRTSSPRLVAPFPLLLHPLPGALSNKCPSKDDVRLRRDGPSAMGTTGRPGT